jgi:hypothetical protein
MDLICVSHIDNDHVNGVVALFEMLSEGTLDSPKVSNIWHNNLTDQLGDLAEEVRPLVSWIAFQARGAAEEAVAENETLMGIPAADELTRLLEDAGIPMNLGFDAGVATTEAAPGEIAVGSIEIRVIGPMESQLEDLRQYWRRWLEEHAGYKNAAETPGPGDVGNVTVPNLASIMFLAVEGGQSMLFSGDGHSAHILEGLDYLGLRGEQHFNVLKVPHHGSEHNMTHEFCRTITADHYVFCANGAHHNPDLGIIEMVATARQSGYGPDGKFSFWFSNSPSTVDTQGQAKHMEDVQRQAKNLQELASGRLRCHFRRESEPYLTVGSS